MVEAAFIVSVVGLAMGSFLNVCAYRIPRGVSLRVRSFCPECRRTLKWYELVPIVSYVVRRGTCSGCLTKIPWRYPVVEIVTGVLVVFLFVMFGATEQFLIVALVATLMLLVAVIDWRYLIVPNRVVAWGAALGVGAKLLFAKGELITSFEFSLYASSTMLAILLLGNWLFKKETMGMGDVKLAGLVGLFLGYTDFLLALWFAALVGSVYGIIQNVVQSSPILDGSGRKIPFGTFLACTSSVIMVLSQLKVLSAQSIIKSLLSSY